MGALTRLDRRSETLGVYVSVPFCRAKCSFCNFASGVGTAEALARYIDALCDEIRAAEAISKQMGARLPQMVDSVYFGGGTPSLLDSAQLRAIFGALRETFDLAAGAEITLEAAPGQITDDLLEAAIECGVNRFSLGVQSFVDAESRAVGRSHTGESCLAEIVRLRRAGVAEVGIDLIAGVPHQSAESWERSLRCAVASEATHLSVYMLEVDEESRLGAEVLAGGVRFHAHAVPAADTSAEMYDAAVAWLEGQAGFRQYEISNFARSDGRDHTSRHNVKYWRREPYIGFGVDAHSMLRAAVPGEVCEALRWADPDSLIGYKGAASGRDVTRVDADAAFEEALFLGLRMNEGVEVQTLQAEFGESRVRAAAGSVREMAEGGVMIVEDGRWCLTARGRAVSNEVFERLLLTKATGTR